MLAGLVFVDYTLTSTVYDPMKLFLIVTREAFLVNPMSPIFNKIWKKDRLK